MSRSSTDVGTFRAIVPAPLKHRCSNISSSGIGAFRAALTVNIEGKNADF